MALRLTGSGMAPELQISRLCGKEYTAQIFLENASIVRRLDEGSTSCRRL
jgi:hypothetical protein